MNCVYIQYCKDRNDNRISVFVVTALHSSQLYSDAQSIVSNDNKLQSELSTTQLMNSSRTQPVNSTGKTRKRSAIYKVSIDKKYFKPSPRTSGVTRVAHEQTLQSNNAERLPVDKCFQYIQPSVVTMEFLDLKLHLGKVLQFCEPKHIISKCGSLLASNTHSIPLFPNDYTEMLQEIKDTPELIQKLSPFMTWDNHSILSTIAETSNIPEATILLTQFDDRIDTSQPLTSFPVPAPSYHMVPYDDSTHTVLAVKLDLELCHSTLQKVIDARSLIQDQCKLTAYCLQLLAVAKTTSTILYWMIPKSIVHLITANASEFHNYYYQKGILQLAVYPGAILCTGSALKVGLLSCFSQIEIDSKSVRIK